MWIPTVLRVWPDPDDKTVAHTGTKKQKQNIIIKTLHQPKHSKSLSCICLWAKHLTAYFLCVCLTGAGPHAADGYHWTRGTCAEQTWRGTSIFVLVFSYIVLVFIQILGRTFLISRYHPEAQTGVQTDNTHTLSWSTMMSLDWSSHTHCSCYTHVVSDTLEASGENSPVPPIVAANVFSTNSKMKALLSTQQLKLPLAWLGFSTLWCSGARLSHQSRSVMQLSGVLRIKSLVTFNGAETELD